MALRRGCRSQIQPRIPHPPRILSLGNIRHPDSRPPSHPCILILNMPKASPLAAASPPAPLAAAPTCLAAAPTCLAVAVPAAAASPPANSSSHKRAYDRFMRRVTSKRHFKPGLATKLAEDKTALFNDWLECDEDFAKVEIMYEKRRTTQERAKTTSTARKLREWRLRYPNKPHVIEFIKRSNRERGLQIPDPACPDDEEEMLFYHLDEASMSSVQMLEESTTLSGSAQVEKEAAVMLMNNENIFGGSLFDEPFHRALEVETDDTPKAKKAKTAPKAKAATKCDADKAELSLDDIGPDNVVEHTKEILERVLQQSTDARTYVVKLQGVDYASKIVKQLSLHASFMEQAYKQLQQLLLAKATDPAQFKPILQVVHDKMAWYTPRRESAKAFATGRLKQTTKAQKKKDQAEEAWQGNRHTRRESAVSSTLQTYTYTQTHTYTRARRHAHAQ